MEKKTESSFKGMYIVLAVSLFALAIVAAGGVYYYKQASDAKNELHNSYMRSFHDLADYINDIDIGLKKIMLSGDAGQTSELSSRLYMQTEAAKTCLTQMPIEDASFDNTSKFLSQAGDYSAFISRQVMENGQLSDEEYSNLGILSEYASAVNREFSKTESAVYDGTVAVESLASHLSFVAYAEGSDFKSEMERIDAVPQEYPSLIYDGPFSEHLDSAEPLLIKDEKEVSQKEAKEQVDAFIGSRGEKTSYTGSGDGRIKTYMFSGDGISIEVTKQGGRVLWFLDSREVGNARLNISQAMSAGGSFLSCQGYHSMKSSYYEVTNNVATINYAYEENGALMYSDLIKVKVALDNGEIVGFEGRGYIMCHRDREIPQNVIGEEKAKEIAGSHLKPDSVSLCFIPKESMREVCCYEIKGSLSGNNFLIYVNAETGAQEKILILEESETGILTI